MLTMSFTLPSTVVAVGTTTAWINFASACMPVYPSPSTCSRQKYPSFARRDTSVVMRVLASSKAGDGSCTPKKLAPPVST